MRYLLGWKIKHGQRVVNARIIVRRFHLEQAQRKWADKASHTLSRLGKNLFFFV